MPDAATLRDSTQIVLPCETVAEWRSDLEDRFTLTIHSGDGACRIIGSPVEIKAVCGFLARRGVSVH